MALKVWLPLNGDINNIGTTSFNFINANATIDANGKIGKCYSFNGSNSRIYADGVSLPNDIFSCACWVYPMNAHSTSGLILCLSTGDVTGPSQQFGLYLKDNYIYINGNGSQTKTNTTLTLNQWYHLCFIINGSTTKFYVNGQLAQSYTNANTPKVGDCLCIGARSASASGAGVGFSYPFQGKINDVRIYDRALFADEIKEIAKGLVLHYPLDNNGWGQENLVTGSNTNNTSTNKWVGHSAVGGNTSTIEQDETGIYCVKVTRDATEQSSWDYLSYDNLLRGDIKTDTVYTVSFDCKPSVNGSISFTGFVNGNATNYMTNSTTTIQGSCIANQWNHMVYQCRTLSSFDSITVSGQVVYFSRSTSLRGVNVTVLFKNIKVEEGSIATPWCPNSSDSIATTLGVNGTTEYDISGYKYNGEKVGTFTYVSDTPKYRASEKHTGANYIHLTPPSSEIATISVWVNWNTIPSGQSVILVDNGSGIGLGLMSTGILCSTSGAGSSYTFSKSSLVANTWYHFVVVKTGTTTRKLYINGVEQTATTNTSNWTFAVNELQLGKRSTTSDGFAGSLSDFRAYATALSAEDVAELYNSNHLD